jgi:hypothetical protein
VQKFRDAKGREWEIAVTYGLCRRLKVELLEKQIDLLEPLLPRGVDPKSPEIRQPAGSQRASLFTELQTDLPLFYDVLEAIVGPQLKAAGIDKDGDEGFGCAMAGDHIFAAQSAFIDEWRSFFRSLHRNEIDTAMAKSQAWWEKAVKAMEAQVSDERIDAAMTRKLAEATSSGSGKLLELLDSIPTTAPSAS